MCGATDCPSCGVAQGYEVVFDPVTRSWINPEPDQLEEEQIE
jgi:hypothetical protein